jgi:hypothetical protein
VSGKLLYIVAGVLLALLLAAVVWLLSQGSGGGLGGGPRASGTNPALDVRYRYNPRLLKPAPYDPNAEFPLQLDGANFSFYGKRLRGAGTMLGDNPAQPMLYDFVGSQQNEVFEYWYRLKPAGKPVYEDARLQGKLALHTRTVYDRTKDSRGWPAYFPVAVTGDTAVGNAADMDAPPPVKGPGDAILDEPTEDQIVRNIAKSGGADKAYVEGWVFYTKNDLFFFYTVSADELGRSERDAAIEVINSMQFDAVLGSTPAPAEKSTEPPAAPSAPEEMGSSGKI